MTVDPATLKVIVSQAINIVEDEEKRNNIILFITILVAVIFLIVIILAYLITNPIDSLKMILSENEKSIVQDMQNFYRIDYGMENITIK